MCWRSLAFAAALSICLGMGVPAQAQIMREPDPPDVGIDQKLGAQVNLDLQFADESGKLIQLKDVFRGKPVVLSLVYFDCPMLCGEIIQGMLSSFNELDFTLGQEYDVVTISFDPSETHELAAMKKQNVLDGYARGGGQDGWRFLTTKDESQVKELAASVGFRYQYMPSIAEFAHGSGIMVLTPEGSVSRYYYGIQYPAQDVKFGLMDAADRKIGSLADKVMLLCYMYDPASGSYGLVIMRVLRVAGVATVMIIAGSIFAFLRLEQRRARIAMEHSEKLAAH
ncbi:MAG: photosynthetic protein synthase I [Candidatus Hydrogenedentota bacterium]